MKRSRLTRTTRLKRAAMKRTRRKTKIRAGKRCPECKVGTLSAESRALECEIAPGFVYLVEGVPGYGCECGEWRPARAWGEGTKRSHRTWREAWAIHRRIIIERDGYGYGYGDGTGYGYGGTLP